MKNIKILEKIKGNDKFIVTCEKAKRNGMALALALSANACMISQVSAAGGAVDATNFITTACTVLKSVIILIGGGVGFLGIMNLLEAYGSDNAASRSQGIKQLMAGLGLILLAITLVPVLQTMMSSAV